MILYKPSLPVGLSHACNRAGILLLAGIVLAFPMTLLLHGGSARINFIYFWTQDAACLFGAAGSFLLLARLSSIPFPAQSLRWLIERPAALTSVLTLVAFAITAVIAFIIFQGFGLSRDELMAEFDSEILRNGRFIAPIAPLWRSYASALTPLFSLPIPTDVGWVSAYLPGNAAFRALVSLGMDQRWSGPILVVTACLAFYGVTRRLWPGRAEISSVALVLFAICPQVLLTGATSYAMNIHLTVNIIWLWLFLCDNKLSHAGAMLVGFYGCGLHQVIFHPLFVAPFIFGLSKDRCWTAVAYVIVYALSIWFWISYSSLIASGAGLTEHDSNVLGSLYFLHRVMGVLSELDIRAPGPMWLNILRFISWQHLLVLPLLVAAWRCIADGEAITRPLASGLLLTVAAMFVLLPYQGHGWGYRYLHGLIGSTCLLAAYGWSYVVSDAPSRQRTAALSALGLATGMTLILIVPYKLAKAAEFMQPYREAVASIQLSDADVVIVDSTHIFYGEDLVRNDPFLQNSPKIMSLRELHGEQLSSLCQRFNVGLFDVAAAMQLGIRETAPSLEFSAAMQAKRALLSDLHCGWPVLLSTR